MVGWDVILGGLTGLIGNIVTGIVNYKTMKVKNSHEAKMVALQTAAKKAENKMRIELASAQIAGEIELADAEAYTKGLEQADKETFSEAWIERLFAVEGWMRYIAIPVALFLATLFGSLDFLRGLMRPGLTIYLTGISSVLTWKAYEILQQTGTAMTANQAVDLYGQTTQIIIYLTVTCVTWWFGDRRMAKFLTQMNDKNARKE